MIYLSIKNRHNYFNLLLNLALSLTTLGFQTQRVVMSAV